jgi:hypothetical protein
MAAMFGAPALPAPIPGGAAGGKAGIATKNQITLFDRDVERSNLRHRAV